MASAKKKIITIAGALGSGKTSTAKAVAEKLGYKHFSSGDIFRALAAERGVSVEAINISAEAQQEIDYLVDNKLQEMYATEDRIVIDSRMAWHWMPGSFKVFLHLNTDTAAERIFAHIQKDGRVGETGSSVAEIRESIDRRFASEQKRYFSLYKVNPTDPENFDIIVNTKPSDLATVCAMVLAAYNAWWGI